MSDVLKFAHEQNLSRLVDQLRGEADEARRDVLRRLLVEEEARFGGPLGRLDSIAVRLADCASRIEAQTARVAVLAAEGEDTREAARLLRNLEEIQTIFWGRREAIHAALRDGEVAAWSGRGPVDPSQGAGVAPEPG